MTNAAKTIFIPWHFNRGTSDGQDSPPCCGLSPDHPSCITARVRHGDFRMNTTRRLHLSTVFALALMMAPVSQATRIENSQKTKDVSSGDEFDFEKMSSMGHLAFLASRGQLERAMARARSRRPGGKTSSADGPAFKAALVTDEAEDGDAEDLPAGGQAETSIAVDSTGRHIVVGYNDTRGFALNPL